MEIWLVVKILINWISRNDQKLQKPHQQMLSLRPKGYSECIITSSYLHTWLKENILFWLSRSDMIYKQWWELKFCTLMLKTKFWRPRMGSQALKVLKNVSTDSSKIHEKPWTWSGDLSANLPFIIAMLSMLNHLTALNFNSSFCKIGMPVPISRL